MMHVVRLASAASRHGRAAFRADQGVFPVHARRDFCFVGDKFRAQPQRIRCTGLTHINGLGGDALRASDQKHAGRQRQAADEAN